MQSGPVLAFLPSLSAPASGPGSAGLLVTAQSPSWSSPQLPPDGSEPLVVLPPAAPRCLAFCRPSLSLGKGHSDDSNTRPPHDV